jgi:hypothetical protein
MDEMCSEALTILPILGLLCESQSMQYWGLLLSCSITKDHKGI